MNALDFLSQEHVKAFIEEHVKADVQQLLLNPPRKFKDRIKLIADQILSRQKASAKLNSWANNFDLIMPPPLSIEQASSEITGEYKALVTSGNHLVDLTGGMGIDCLKLGSRFNKVSYVERQVVLCDIFKHNARILEQPIEVYNKTAEDFLTGFRHDLETVFYLDPARRDDSKKRVFKLTDCTPNVVDIFPLLKEKAVKVLIKLSPLLDLSSIQSSLSMIKSIHIVSVKNDCKEILLDIDFNFDGETKVVCVNLSSGQENYSYTWKDEFNSPVEIGETSAFLYEPNSSILKAGAFKKIAHDFSIKKIALNTHLYTSDKIRSNFPGRIFEVKSFVDKQALKELKGRTINVITRNYSLSTTELKKRWGIKDGGKEFLIAFKDAKNKPRTVVAERLHF